MSQISSTFKVFNLIDDPHQIIQTTGDTTFLSTRSGPADHRQADPDGASDWQGAVRRGVAWPLARRKSGCQSVLYKRGGQLVPGDRDLPDGPDETREHPRYLTVTLHHSNIS